MTSIERHPIDYRQFSPGLQDFPPFAQRAVTIHFGEQ